MSHPRDDHKLFPVVYRVDNAVVTDAGSKVVTTGKLDGARRSRIDRQTVDRRLDAFGDGSQEPAVRLDRVRMETDVVRLAGCYLRTLAQGMARAASSRAWNAARLSSRYSARSTMARYSSTSMRTAVSRPRLDTKRTSSLERS